MPSRKDDKIPLACPQCGHVQQEPRTAYSTVCKKCHAHYRPQEVLQTATTIRQPIIERRRVQCFQCGTELDVPITAESTMCKRCSGHLDLRDYHISQAISKNFRTKGRLIIEEKGYIFNTDSIVSEAVIKGRFLGKLVAERTLEVHSTAEIKGNVTTALLIVPAGNRFLWKETFKFDRAEIRGELQGDIRTEGTILLKSNARFFGDVEAMHLVVEEGAIVVGSTRIGAVVLPSPPPDTRAVAQRGRKR